MKLIEAIACDGLSSPLLMIVEYANGKDEEER